MYTSQMQKNLKRLFIGIVLIFALIGFVLTTGYVAMKFKLTSTRGVIDTASVNFAKPTNNSQTYTEFPLAHTPEWNAFKQAVAKDKVMIEKVSKETGVEPRLLIAILVPEQMRLFHSERPIFKRVFEPLKVLGSQSQFSWGIFGIKDETARAVESHLTDKTSPFYLGTAFENSLAFASTTAVDEERFERIIDEHNHLYSYRYTALFVLQVQSQWRKAGFPIDNNPAVIATLWNLGFAKSKPNSSPKSGGAAIDISGTTYSFGALASAFYYSDELIELFPAAKR